MRQHQMPHAAKSLPLLLFQIAYFVGLEPGRHPAPPREQAIDIARQAVWAFLHLGDDGKATEATAVEEGSAEIGYRQAVMFIHLAETAGFRTPICLCCLPRPELDGLYREALEYLAALAEQNLRKMGLL